jgi:2-amino-4-hydroxy-6-hydroxymethyldihydropteridine diphosphokinase
VAIEALISLGGNMGDRKAIADEAVARLARLPDSSISGLSSYYRTEPVGPVMQAWFLNMALSMRTAMSLDGLLQCCNDIEAALGRDRSVEIPWGPRPIDIDVVAFRHAGDPVYTARDKLDRAFILIPLAEIAREEWIEGEKIIDRAAAVDRSGVSVLDWGHPGRSS